jgi:hypothetical protein
MKRYFDFLLKLLTAGIIVSCGLSKAGRPTNHRPSIHTRAWNEDTLNPYQFAYYSDSSFTYYIPQPGSPRSGVLLKGIIIKDKFDTFFLKYRNDKQPKTFTNYLIRETSGNYLIQPLKDKPDRIYLRIIGRFR